MIPQTSSHCDCAIHAWEFELFYFLSHFDFIWSLLHCTNTNWEFEACAAWNASLQSDAWKCSENEFYIIRCAAYHTSDLWWLMKCLLFQAVCCRIIVENRTHIITRNAFAKAKQSSAWPQTLTKKWCSVLSQFLQKYASISMCVCVHCMLKTASSVYFLTLCEETIIWHGRSP